MAACNFGEDPSQGLQDGRRLKISISRASWWHRNRQEWTAHPASSPGLFQFKGNEAANSESSCEDEDGTNPAFHNEQRPATASQSFRVRARITQQFLGVRAPGPPRGIRGCQGIQPAAVLRIAKARIRPSIEVTINGCIGFGITCSTPLIVQEKLPKATPAPMAQRRTLSTSAGHSSRGVDAPKATHELPAAGPASALERP